MSTTPSRSEALFSDVLARPLEEREAFLDAACQGDESLKRRILALLAAHAGPESLMISSALAAGPRASLLEEKPGDVIARYKLLQKIGEGGCGVVWMAEQEEPVRRRVALKVIKLGMDTKSVVARFEAERQALAMMDHSCIAKVHDAGATETGRPFFVMELVRGIPITKYCDENHLTPTARLELFIKVCQAIQHAHQKGVIHRDIKPSNILVTVNDGAPTPKVIDFGIAKATQGKLTDATVFTAFEQFIGTPIYMSPEQAEMSSLDIDTRSDIYSLGVLLYELLTGRPPFDPKKFAQAGVDQIRQRIREAEPPRPSARLRTLDDDERTTIARLRNTAASELSIILRGDLDWIVMRCIEKDRTRRYDTANGLAADIQRYLRNEPVIARPPSTAYLLRKLIRRHRVAFVATLAIMLALVFGLAVSVWSLRNEKLARARATAAEKEQTRSRRQADESRRVAAEARISAEKLLSFVFTDLAEQLDDFGQMDLLRQISERAIAYYEALPAALHTRESRASYAFALAGVGSLAESWNQRRDKVRLEHAMRIFEELEATGPLTPFTQVVFAASLCESAQQTIAEGRSMMALPLLDRGMKILEPALADTDWGGWAHRLMGKILERKADGGLRIGGFSAAAVQSAASIPMFERAARHLEEADRRPPAPRRPGLRALIASRNLPEALYYAGRRADARAVAARMKAQSREFIEREPFLISARFMYTWSSRGSCLLLNNQWRFAEYAETLAEQDAHYHVLLQLEPANASFQGNLAAFRASFADANWFDYEWKQRNFWAAETQVRRGIESLGALQAYPLYYDTLLCARFNSARLYAAIGNAVESDHQLAEAERLYARSLRERALEGADRELHQASFAWNQATVAFESLNWSGMRRHAEAALECFGRVKPEGLEPVRILELRSALHRTLVRAMVEMNDYAGAQLAVDRWAQSATLERPEDDMQQRFDRAGDRLLCIQVMSRTGRHDMARAEMVRIWPEIENLYSAGREHVFNQVQTARALSMRAEVDGDATEKRDWLERALHHLRPAEKAGKLTRYERDILLATITKQVAALDEGRSP